MITDRFIVLGAFQTLNATEARHHFGLEDEACELVFLEPPQPRAAAETRRMIAETGWRNVREIGPPNTSVRQWHRKVRNGRGLIDGSRELHHLFLGDYQMQLGIHAANGLRGGGLVALDDGLATLRINAHRSARAARRRPPRLQPQVRWLEHAGQRVAARGLGLQLRDPDSLTMFTIYDIDPAPADRVVRNEYGWLRQRYDAPTVVDGTLFLGSPLVESGILPADLYRTSLRRLRATTPEPLWYRPHPREDVERVTALLRETGAKLLELETVVEVGLLQQGWVPRTVVANHSTTLDTLRVILDDAVSIRSVPVPAELVPRRWRPFIEMAYGELDGRLGRPVERLELL